MRRQTLQAVGLKTVSDIPAMEIFSSNFEPAKYGLKESARRRLSVLRDFVSEYNREIPVDNAVPITNSLQAAGAMFDVFRGLEHEEVWALYLNGAGRPITKVRIGEGGLEAVFIDKRKIVRTAIEKNASGVILYHNHPSGAPEPSSADVKETEALNEMFKVLEIQLVDHIIISDTRYYSFSEEKCVNFKKKP